MSECWECGYRDGCGQRCSGCLVAESHTCESCRHEIKCQDENAMYPMTRALARYLGEPEHPVFFRERA